jgi:hypothetical protein
MTSDQVFQLILGFISSLVSGAVAGLIVGLVVLRRQFGQQLVLDDEIKLIDILHSLEGMSQKIEGALAWQKLGKELKGFDEAEADNKVFIAHQEVQYLELRQLPSRIEYLRSRKYERIKVYLISAIKTCRLESDDPEQTVKNIREFLTDIQNQIYHYYGFVNRLRLIWQALTMIVTHNAPTLEEKTLLAEAARHTGGVSQSETTGFIVWDRNEKLSLQEMLNTSVEYRSVSIPDSELDAGGPLSMMQLYSDAPYIAALTKLQQRGLIRQGSNTTSALSSKLEKYNREIKKIEFVLTGDGWWAGLEYAKNQKYTLKQETSKKSN